VSQAGSTHTGVRPRTSSTDVWLAKPVLAAVAGHLVQVVEVHDLRAVVQVGVPHDRGSGVVGLAGVHASVERAADEPVDVPPVELHARLGRRLARGDLLGAVHALHGTTVQRARTSDPATTASGPRGRRAVASTVAYTVRENPAPGGRVTAILLG